MPERMKKTKCGGGDVAKKKIEGGMPERVKKMKCGGGGGGLGCENNLKVGWYAGEGRKTKCGRGRGCCEKNLRGVCRRG